MWGVLGGTEELQTLWKSKSVRNVRLEKCKAYLQSCGDWRSHGPLPLCLHGDEAIVVPYLSAFHRWCFWWLPSA